MKDEYVSREAEAAAKSRGERRSEKLWAMFLAFVTGIAFGYCWHITQAVCE